MLAGPGPVTLLDPSDASVICERQAPAGWEGWLASGPSQQPNHALYTTDAALFLLFAEILF